MSRGPISAIRFSPTGAADVAKDRSAPNISDAHAFTRGHASPAVNPYRPAPDAGPGAESGL